MMSKWAKVGDLADHILDKTRAGEFLYNPETGEEYSGNKGDYWDSPDDHEFTGFILVTKTTVYKEV